MFLLLYYLIFFVFATNCLNCLEVLLFQPTNLLMRQEVVFLFVSQNPFLGPSFTKSFLPIFILWEIVCWLCHIVKRDSLKRVCIFWQKTGRKPLFNYELSNDFAFYKKIKTMGPWWGWTDWKKEFPIHKVPFVCLCTAFRFLSP